MEREKRSRAAGTPYSQDGGRGGSWVISDLRKTVFPEDCPGSEVSGGQAREKMRRGGYFCCSSCDPG